MPKINRETAKENVYNYQKETVASTFLLSTGFLLGLLYFSETYFVSYI